MATIRVRLDLKLDEVTAKARVNIDRAVAKAAFDTEALAKAKAPYESGLLMNSIRHERHGEAWYQVESPVHYSVYQEYGTSRMYANPYMHPAVEMVKPTLMLALQKAVQ